MQSDPMLGSPLLPIPSFALPFPISMAQDDAVSHKPKQELQAPGAS